VPAIQRVSATRILTLLLSPPGELIISSRTAVTSLQNGVTNTSGVYQIARVMLALMAPAWISRHWHHQATIGRRQTPPKDLIGCETLCCSRIGQFSTAYVCGELLIFKPGQMKQVRRIG
jgi:hypothetical protein